MKGLTKVTVYLLEVNAEYLFSFFLEVQYGATGGNIRNSEIETVEDTDTTALFIRERRPDKSLLRLKVGK